MAAQYCRAACGGLKFSPLWEAESVVFNPDSTEIFVITDAAARLLRVVQRHATPVPVSDLVAEVETELGHAAPGDLREELEAMLVEFDRLGLVESAAP